MYTEEEFLLISKGIMKTKKGKGEKRSLCCIIVNTSEYNYIILDYINFYIGINWWNTTF